MYVCFLLLKFIQLVVIVLSFRSNFLFNLIATKLQFFCHFICLSNLDLSCTTICM